MTTTDTESTAIAPAPHTTSVQYQPAARYPWKPVCHTCDWPTWGYVAEHAAQGMADWHSRTGLLA